MGEPAATLIVPLIMCGGAGTRLWPASREGRPKQFLPLFGAHSTFQNTIRRVSDPRLFGRPIVIAGHRHRFLVAEQLEAIGVQADILLEPMRRDSGPALAAGAEFAAARDGDPVIAALAADHVVSDAAAFAAACRSALPVVDQGKIVTFGVRPSRPATEYGYIMPGLPLGDGVYAVKRFVEKPDEASARRYVDSGYLWNSGNFMFRAATFLKEYRDFEAASADAIAAAVGKGGCDLGFVMLDAQEFARAAAKSVDYAVMERTACAAVIPVGYPWSDVGSWQAVWELAERDAAGNAVQGKAVFVDTKGSYVASDKALVGVLGVDDLVVVASEDAVLVSPRGRCGELKRLIEVLKERAPTVIEEHLKVHRPWGSYRSLDEGERYQVKRIVVKPGKRLSLQLHHHRAEHWIVVRGTARVTIGDACRTIHENQSTYIPIGEKHRLENIGKIDLELIEVQTGSYLGEDDIERFDDDYHRA
ncbi:MAG: mannose-1-phosphate guanylyltransferase/mannose-6-phosphate isomerase [Hyphomicrobiales bacterium]|nr:mannose-1-phosphate guanylyltransferase/mannose-6-phosphate isomerase [Hyphomicrobiales bacterium]